MFQVWNAGYIKLEILPSDEKINVPFKSPPFHRYSASPTLSLLKNWEAGRI